MPVVHWPLHQGRPIIEIKLTLGPSPQRATRQLVADTGAGTSQDVFELILEEDDCLQGSGIPIHQVRLRGAYAGSFPVYLLDIRIPALRFDDSVAVCGVPTAPQSFDGIACFKFLRRFTYGNFGQLDSFGLEASCTS